MWNTSLVSLLRSPGKSIFGDDEFLWKSKKLLRPTLRLVWGKGGATAVDCSLLRNNNKNGNNNKHFHCWALLKFKLIIDLISGNPHCYHFFSVSYHPWYNWGNHSSERLSNIPADTQQSVGKLAWEWGLSDSKVSLPSAIAVLPLQEWRQRAGIWLHLLCQTVYVFDYFHPWLPGLRGPWGAYWFPGPFFKGSWEN